MAKEPILHSFAYLSAEAGDPLPALAHDAQERAGRHQAPDATHRREGTTVMDMKLEVVVVPVSDVDRAKEFYATGLQCREDADLGGGDFRVVQMTPPGSTCSIIFGTGVTTTMPGSLDRLLLAVDNIDKARAELIDRGVDVGEVFHDAGGGLGGGWRVGSDGRAAGPDPQGRSYGSYATFRDPDGNNWMLQELNERLPGRVW
jgi:catechol 2,3-dioxygenase-like lactoylglutathione lyase family enzyme